MATANTTMFRPIGTSVFGALPAGGQTPSVALVTGMPHIFTVAAAVSALAAVAALRIRETPLRESTPAPVAAPGSRGSIG